MQVVISKSGEARFIHDDDVAGMLAPLGEARIRRASHVEPAAWGWTADMSPVGGPVLGPFLTRREALEEEVKWIESKGTPEPR